MYQSFHYEFDNILDIRNIYYKISIPRLKDAVWVKAICYAPIPKITIKVIANHILLQKIELDSSFREMLDDMKQTYMTDFTRTSSRITCFTPLFPYNFYETFEYLSKSPMKYKVICDVEINDKINFYNYCIPEDGKIPKIIGKFEVEEIVNDPKIIIKI